MSRFRAGALALLLPCVASARRVAPEEERIREALKQQAPKALTAFDDATDAMDKAEMSMARRLFEAVLGEAPNFAPAMRRLAYVMTQEEEPDLDSAEQLARESLAIEDSPDGRIVLASVLLTRNSIDSNKEALAVLKDLVTRKSPDRTMALLLVEAATRLRDADTVKWAIPVLKDLTPDPETREKLDAMLLRLGGPAPKPAASSEWKGALQSSEQAHYGDASRSAPSSFLRRGSVVLVMLGLGLVLMVAGVIVLLRSRARRRPAE
ncbi:MAG: hypothetical protein AABZ30_11975 [Myxococcota bacterium]